MATYLLTTDRQRSVLPGLQAYSPYGFMKATPASSLGFCGQRRDPLTGNYPLGNGHRFYSPTLMRFMEPDLLSPFSRGGINGYAYCGGDPVNRHDPSGAFWASLVLRALGLASSGATLLGAIVRTARNVVGRRATRPAPSAGETTQARRTSFAEFVGPPIASHQELPHPARVANQMFALTGTAGVASHVALMANGVPAGISSLSDGFGLVNTISNLSGGLVGTSSAAFEVGQYMVANPSQIGSVAFETVMDLTMIDEMLSAGGRMLTGAARRIRSSRPAPFVTHA